MSSTSAVLIKPIKAARLKDNALRMTLMNKMRPVGAKAVRILEDLTKDWEHDIEPEYKMSFKDLEAPTLEITVDDEIFYWVDQGTEGPYPIFAGYYTGKTDKKHLPVPTFYGPKTNPNTLMPVQNFLSVEVVYRPYVTHPGIEPRNFMKTLEKELEPWFKKQMEDGMSAAAKASGHSSSESGK